ncbi:hypothetical protein, partial [Sutterella wadsworthensis]|uniref:hypothetical protein n=1 Tax=Sutterella wadsworthensis TaxID=40545 RepID=UPI0026DBE9C4
AKIDADQYKYGSAIREFRLKKLGAFFFGRTASKRQTSASQGCSNPMFCRYNLQGSDGYV